MNMKCVGARVIGSNHSICQDEILYKCNKDFCIIAVSDGAGSKQYSHLGARIALYVLERFFNGFDFAKAEEMDYSFVEEGIKKELLYEIKSAIKIDSWKHDLSENDYSCTLAFVLVYKDKFYIKGHIGDGGILSLRGDKMQVISAPSNGEYKNETFFVTSENAKDYLNISIKDIGDEKAFLVCTDGIGDLLFQEKSGEYSISPVAKTLCDWLLNSDSDEEIELVGMAYEANLRDVFAKKSKDDLSFCVLTRS